VLEFELHLHVTSSAWYRPKYSCNSIPQDRITRECRIHSMFSRLLWLLYREIASILPRAFGFQHSCLPLVNRLTPLLDIRVGRSPHSLCAGFWKRPGIEQLTPFKQHNWTAVRCSASTTARVCRYCWRLSCGVAWSL
jgi:hypothetical protein